jgi:hypothetical protein
MKIKISKSISAFILCTAFLLVSCTQESEQKETRENAEQPEASSTDDLKAIELDHVKTDSTGNRWTTNDATRKGIAAMKKATSEYITGAEKDIKAVQEKLDKSYKNIFRMCTMRGEGHNQLHNYLGVLRERIDALNEKTTIEDVKELYVYLLSYDLYFV